MSELNAEPHPGLDPSWWQGRGWQRGERSYRAITSGDLDHLRRWRNEQQDVLRQQQPLTSEHQLHWFTHVVAPAYEQRQPAAMLVVADVDGEPVGYGGLTNIEWTSRRGELSFLAATERASSATVYHDDFVAFLGWVFDLAFDELKFNRVFTETWAFRTAHVAGLESAGMRHEGTMRKHISKDGVLHDALLHGILCTDPGRR